MTKLARAAAVYLLTQPIIDGVKKANADAADVLKEHFRRTGRASYRGIRYSTSPHSYLAVDEARAALGPARTAACTRHTVKEHLSLPGDAKPIVPPELEELVQS